MKPRLFFQVSRKDFEGFKNLFHRFLQVKGPSIEWIKIQRPPEDSVRPLHSFSVCEGEFMVMEQRISKK